MVAIKVPDMICSVRDRDTYSLKSASASRGIDEIEEVLVAGGLDAKLSGPLGYGGRGLLTCPGPLGSTMPR